MTNVIDLLSRRANHGQTVLHFTTAVEAMAFATRQIRDLERLTDSALVIAASDLKLPLAQAAAVLVEVTRLLDNLPHEENA